MRYDLFFACNVYACEQTILFFTKNSRNLYLHTIYLLDTQLRYYVKKKSILLTPTCRVGEKNNKLNQRFEVGRKCVHQFST